METRTSFKLLDNGIVYCSCGSVRDFAEDLSEFVVPMLEWKIDAEINNKTITIYSYDNVEDICKRFMKAF